MYKDIKVRAYTLKEAEEIMKFCLRNGYEGVQNDSYRYCKDMAKNALHKGVCYICVRNGGFGNIIVCDTHYKKNKSYTELSKSKFFNVLLNYNAMRNFKKVVADYDKVLLADIKLTSKLETLSKTASDALGFRVVASICNGGEIEFRKYDCGVVNVYSCLTLEDVKNIINNENK